MLPEISALPAVMTTSDASAVAAQSPRLHPGWLAIFPCNSIDSSDMDLVKVLQLAEAASGSSTTGTYTQAESVRIKVLPQQNLIHVVNMALSRPVDFSELTLFDSGRSVIIVPRSKP